MSSSSAGQPPKQPQQPDQQQCPACHEPLSSQTTVHLPSCQHVVCTDCLKDNLEHGYTFYCSVPVGDEVDQFNGFVCHRKVKREDMVLLLKQKSRPQQQQQQQQQQHQCTVCDEHLTSQTTVCLPCLHIVCASCLEDALEDENPHCVAVVDEGLTCNERIVGDGVLAALEQEAVKRVRLSLSVEDMQPPMPVVVQAQRPPGVLPTRRRQPDPAPTWTDLLFGTAHYLITGRAPRAPLQPPLVEEPVPEPALPPAVPEHIQKQDTLKEHLRRNQKQLERVETGIATMDKRLAYLNVHVSDIVNFIDDKCHVASSQAASPSLAREIEERRLELRRGALGMVNPDSKIVEDLRDRLVVARSHVQSLIEALQGAVSASPPLEDRLLIPLVSRSKTLLSTDFVLVPPYLRTVKLSGFDVLPADGGTSASFGSLSHSREFSVFYDKPAHRFRCTGMAKKLNEDNLDRIAVTKDRKILVGESRSDMVQLFSLSGLCLGAISFKSVGSFTSIGRPEHVAACSNGNIWISVQICDDNQYYFYILSSSLAVLHVMANQVGKCAALLASDDDHVYVLTTMNHLFKYTAGGLLVKEYEKLALPALTYQSICGSVIAGEIMLVGVRDKGVYCVPLDGRSEIRACFLSNVLDCIMFDPVERFVFALCRDEQRRRIKQRVWTLEGALVMEGDPFISSSTGEKGVFSDNGLAIFTNKKRRAVAVC